MTLQPIPSEFYNIRKNFISFLSVKYTHMWNCVERDLIEKLKILVATSFQSFFRGALSFGGHCTVYWRWLCSEAGVLDESYSAKPAQRSSHTWPPGYIGWTVDTVPACTATPLSGVSWLIGTSETTKTATTGTGLWETCGERGSWSGWRWWRTRWRRSPSGHRPCSTSGTGPRRQGSSSVSVTQVTPLMQLM